MASTNINKIVCSNLNFKPWIASKNTAEIVNGYVQRLYKQVPDTFKMDLLKPPITAKPERKFSLKAPRPPINKFTFPIIATKQGSKLRANGYRSPLMTARNSFTTSPPKKLFKSPNFKIYNKRRYASSASSSNASFVRNNKTFEENRKQMYKPKNGSQFRTFTGTTVMSSANYYNSPRISQYLAPTRLFNDVTSHEKSCEISKVICKDLMPVGRMLKQQIRLAKPKPPFVEPLDMPKNEDWRVSLKGWDHPSAVHLNKLTATPVIKKPPTLKNETRDQQPFRLISVKRKSYGSKLSPSSPSPRRENTRYQTNSGPYYGISAKPIVSKKDEHTSNDKFEPKYDFVCRSKKGNAGLKRSQQSMKGYL